MLENVRLALYGIWSHKLRSGLTMLGIIIGIAAIIAIVSTIRGTNEQIKQNLIGAGNNSVVVQLFEGDFPIMMDYYQLPEGIPVISDEVKTDIERLREVAAVSLFTSRSAYGSVYFGNRSLDGGFIYGVDDDYFEVYGYRVISGRSFVEDDYKLSRKVVILDETSSSSLFPDGNSVDRIIEIMGEPFTIIGICKQSSEFMPVINTIEDYYTYMNTSVGTVFIPNSVWSLTYRYDEPQSVAVQAVNTDSMTSAGKKTADILNSNLSLSLGSPIKYKSQNLLEHAKDLQDLASATQRQLIWIASISLIVGGIGVMNIMLVSVTERKREIGIKKAVGARKSMILLQFLTEASVLTCIGGVIGVIAGIILSQLVSRISDTPSAISLPFVLISVIFSVLIGLVFGLLPAVKAANQNPIDALRQQ